MENDGPGAEYWINRAKENGSLCECVYAGRGHPPQPRADLLAIYGQMMAQSLVAKEPRDMGADEPIIVEGS